MEFKGWFESTDYIAITMELVEHGDLATYLGGRARPEEEAKEIVGQVLEGLELMHGLGIIHRDLKPAVRESLC